MIVDDDETTCLAVSSLLRARGYDVTARSEAFGTTLAIRREKPGIVILDVEMPGLNGEAIAKILQDQDPSPAIVFHSSRRLDELERIVQQTGALGAIRKNDPRRFVEDFEDLLDLQGK
jgi:FixJ family two-component response regulator